MAKKPKPPETPIASDHDLIVEGAHRAHEQGDYIPMLGLADKLDEDGRLGGNLLRHSYVAKVHHSESAHPQLAYSAYQPNETEGLSPDGKLYTRLEIGPRDVSGEHFRPILSVTHFRDDENKPDANFLHHHIPVRSKQHFRELLRGLPTSMQKPLVSQILRAVQEHHAELPDAPDPERDGPVRLARTQMRVDNAGSAAASAGSTNHDKRLQVVREVLKEAGLHPSTARAALAHEGTASRPSFATVVQKAAHPDLLRYTAAWLGLMTGEKRMAVVHPDPEGSDFLHVISAPGTPDQLTQRLHDAGVPKFTTETTPAGSRAFVLNPLGRYPVERIAQGIPNASHSVARVRVYRLGAGESTDAAADAAAGGNARSAYRGVIDKFERAAGAGPTSGQATPASV